MAGTGTSQTPPFHLRTARLEAQFLATMRGLQARCRPWFTPPLPAVAIAVSGGGDSLALAHLLHQTRSAWGGHALICLMVDHGLQPGSRAVLERLAPDLRARGFGVEILPDAAAVPSPLSPPLPSPPHNVQAWARQFRYACMTAWCQAHGIRLLFVGHTQDDVVTGFLQGLRRGSGAAALPPWRLENGVLVLRPLLSFSREALADFIRTQGLVSVEDPTNPESERGQLGAAMRGPLARLGFQPARLAAWAHRLADNEACLDACLEDRLRQAGGQALQRGYGGFRLQRDFWMALPHGLRFRLVLRLLRALRGAYLRLEGAKIETLLATLSCPTSPSQPVTRTFGGGIWRWRGNFLEVWRDWGRCPTVTLRASSGHDEPPYCDLCWDKRWSLRITPPPNVELPLRVGPLGRRFFSTKLSFLSTVPHLARCSFPVAWPVAWQEGQASGGYCFMPTVVPAAPTTLPPAPAVFCGSAHLCAPVFAGSSGLTGWEPAPAGLAGVEGLEPPAPGFGDRCSTD